MAKKGGAQQLQAEINNDEDFERFLEKYPEALMVLDVYTEWCGPCIGAINALRKIKMELGGDRLQLAICKSDNITRLHRFYKKSEPSWLFVRGGKSVNLMLGSNIPKLMELIKLELNRLELPLDKINNIAIEELHPEEKKRLQVKLDRIAAIESRERYEREKKRRDYLMFCTDAILENLPDVGVTVFGPQVTREMFKKINEPADALKISCKDKRFQMVTKEDFETVNFACPSPLPDDVIEELTKQEILICFWKISEDSKESVPHIMHRYVHELTKKVIEPPDEYNPQERVIPPIIEPMKMKVIYEVEPDAVCPPDEDDDLKAKGRASQLSKKADDELLVEENSEGEEEEEGESKEDKAPAPAVDMALDFDFGTDDISAQIEEEEEIEIIDEPPPKKLCTKTVHMPAVWTPSDERTQAALIYVFFRVQTLPFLQPDPPPEPPHVVMAFDTYKKRDLISIAERNKDEIPCYGFFTSDDADEAKYIANSVQKYVAHQPSAPDDKLVFKVNKRTSHMMLSLASYGATYVSPNTTVGKEEALKFFPEDYRTAEQDRLDALEAQKKAAAEATDEKVKDKKKGARATFTVPEAVKPEPEIELDTFDAEDFAEVVDQVEGEGDGEADEGYGGEVEGGEAGEDDEGGEGGEVGEGVEVDEGGVAGEGEPGVAGEGEPEKAPETTEA